MEVESILSKSGIKLDNVVVDAVHNFGSLKFATEADELAALNLYGFEFHFHYRKLIC